MMENQEYDPRITAFINRLEKLDPGDRARLKRDAGCTLAEAQSSLGLFYSLLPYNVPHQQEEIYFLVATLFPLAEGNSKDDLGGSLKRARQEKKNAKGLDRRVEILLDADLTQIPFRLRQVVHFLKSNRVPVNWPGLLSDLLYWTHPDRFVQQRWARSYFAG